MLDVRLLHCHPVPAGERTLAVRLGTASSMTLVVPEMSAGFNLHASAWTFFDGDRDSPDPHSSESRGRGDLPYAAPAL